MGNRFIPPFAISLIWVKQSSRPGTFFPTFAVGCDRQLIFFLTAFPGPPGTRRGPRYDPRVFPTPRSITATARWLLALLAFVAIAASPAHVAVAITRAAPGSDLCSALHGAKSGRPAVPGGAPAVAHDCGACAFCAAPAVALPPAALAWPVAAAPAIRPVDRVSSAPAGWTGVVARARGPPARA